MSLHQKSIHCVHCGTAFVPKVGEQYCCNGCYYVAQLIQENGLEQFYELKGNALIPPVGSRVFQTEDNELLEAAFKTAEADSSATPPSLRLYIEGISCIGCVWLIETIYKRRAGAGAISINPQNSTIELSWQRGGFDIVAFARELHRIGYRILHAPDDSQEGARDSSQLTHRIGLCGFFLLNTMLFTLPGYLGMAEDFFLTSLFRLLSALFATLSLIVGGGYFIHRAWQAVKMHTLHIDLPIAIGLLAAYAGSLVGFFSEYKHLIYFDFVATFAFLMLCGRWLQEYALEKNRSQLQRRQFGPNKVVCDDGSHLPVESIGEDLAYSVPPGKINPVAANLLDSRGALSLEWINGEPDPVTWSSERPVPAGAINVGLNSLRFRARESWSESLLARLLECNEATFTDRNLQTILRRYIASVLVVASLGGIAWLLATADPLRALQVVISILIVSCPCALGIALPLCNELATTTLRRTGLFVKSSLLWERLRKVKIVVFDKTGTLTLDIPRLRNSDCIQKLDTPSIRALYRMVANNYHPVARALREALLAHHPKTAKSDDWNDDGDIEEVIGKGILWKDSENNNWSLGAPEWMSKDLKSTAGARSVLRKNGHQVAAFDFIEDIRDEARSSIAGLRDRGLNIAILSGDAPERVDSIARQLKIPSDATGARCSPEEKAKWIERNAPESALMLGDGANDSLAFEKAVCRGTPVADHSILESSADFFFFGRSLRCLPNLFTVAAKRRQTALILFAFAVFYNVAAVGICLAGHMHPLLAAILMPLSSIATLAIAWSRLT